ncbi:MAG TPA: serine hydrolase domain-containing protein [Gammaproteobacteria bacterium]|nr:serine hydrolase domain-containing protein [Gammaproteobacteria bacterium]
MLRLVLVLAFAALAPCHLHAQNRLADSAEIDRYLAGVVADTQIPGVVAMVADADRTLYTGAFGKQDTARDIAMAPDTIFRIASMTKPVTSVAIMMLVQQGDLGLDDPVSQYLPAFESEQVMENFNPADKSYTTRPARTPITIRHLLTHTSGLGYAFSSSVLAALIGGDPTASAANLPLLHDPGTKWTYGESTRVLGKVVEEVSGQPLDEFMHERIFVPLGMSDTFYEVPPQRNGRVATVHRTTPQGLVEDPNPAQIDAPVYGDGGLHSTAADYVKFMQMFLNNGRAPDGRRLLSEASVKLMGQNQSRVTVELQPTANPAVSQPFPLGAGRDSFGLGFQVTGAHDDPLARSPGSLSWAGIYNTEFWIDPKRGVCAVLLMQYLPFYDAAAIAALQGFERRVYQGLSH